MRPDLQKSPHNSFEEEIEYLQEIFNGGDAYALGRLNSECWYLYTLNKPMSITEADQTLEMIMTNLDPKVMDIFTKDVCSTSEECTEVIFGGNFLNYDFVLPDLNNCTNRLC